MEKIWQNVKKEKEMWHTIPRARELYGDNNYIHVLCNCRLFEAIGDMYVANMNVYVSNFEPTTPHFPFDK